MNILYSATLSHKDKGTENTITNTLPSYIKSLGHQVTVLLYDPSNPHDTESFDEVVRQILDADIFISEMSRASQTLGFQLSFALANTKPCLYLYRSGTNSDPGSILRNNPSRLLKIKKYDEATYAKVFNSFIKFAEQQQKTVRTSFMSTRKIDNSVSQVSINRGVSKGEAIRQLLDHAIRDLGL